MKRGYQGALAITMLIAGQLVAVAASVGAQSEATSGPADCGAKTYRLMFWPDGHEALQTKGFPEYLVPHLEVYKGKGNRYRDKDVVGYAESSGAQVSAKCEPATANAAPEPPENEKAVTDAAKITCKLKSRPILGTGQVPVGGAVLSLTLGARRVAVVRLTPMGVPLESSVLYDPELCKVRKPPK